MEQKLIIALNAHYTAKLHRAEANLVNYFKNPAGIGEHPDIVEEMIKQIDDMAAARDGLEIIASLTTPPAEESAPPAEENN